MTAKRSANVASAMYGAERGKRLESNEMMGASFGAIDALGEPGIFYAVGQILICLMGSVVDIDTERRQRDIFLGDHKAKSPRT